MVKGGEQPDDLDVSIRWPKGYDDEEAAPSRRRRKASVPNRSAGRRRTPVSAPTTAEEPFLVPPTAVAATPESDRSEHEAEASEDGAGASGLNERVDRLGEQMSALTNQITEALAASDKAVRRVEQLTSALSVEVAEIGQAISDQIAGYSSATTDEVRTRGEAVSAAVEGINESMTDSLATVTQRLEGLAAAAADDYDRPSASPADGLGDTVEGTSEAVMRIETLVEALIEASDARPTDISEFSARTLERLGLTVGSRFEASTTNAVAAVDAAVNQAVDRAIAQFKEVAPPLVDRSTTSAITRLEERVAALTRQRDEHDRETKVTLNGLEETVGRLASAQAEDLERILDTIEGVSSPATAPAAAKPDDDRLARIETSLAALAEATPARPDLSDVAEQFDTVNKHLEALRRRLPLRARPGAAGVDDRSLSELAALIAEHLQAAETVQPARNPRAGRPSARASTDRPTRSPSTEATSSRVRRRPPSE